MGGSPRSFKRGRRSGNNADRALRVERSTVRSGDTAEWPKSAWRNWVLDWVLNLSDSNALLRMTCSRGVGEEGRFWDHFNTMLASS